MGKGKKKFMSLPLSFGNRGEEARIFPGGKRRLILLRSEKKEKFVSPLRGVELWLGRRKGKPLIPGGVTPSLRGEREKKGKPLLSGKKSITEKGGKKNIHFTPLREKTNPLAITLNGKREEKENPYIKKKRTRRSEFFSSKRRWT